MVGPPAAFERGGPVDVVGDVLAASSERASSAGKLPLESTAAWSASFCAARRSCHCPSEKVVPATTSAAT
jgi:hypothetical protein